MEFSSPLAAMQPPPRPFGGFGRDITNLGARPRHTGIFGKPSFNFRDLSMKKPTSDYFSIKASVRGSSPTASLAADLSQNMHIDQSPQLPTPRRNLFTYASKIDREGATTPPILSWEGVTTPPIPSSSPGYAADTMDISPLPHKAPFTTVREITVQPPTPEETVDEDMTSSCEVQDRVHTQFASDRSLERKRSSFLRPAIQRNRFASLGNLAHTSESTSPAFTFGAGCTGSESPAGPLLDDAFKSSPPQEKNPFDSCFNTHASRPKLFAGCGTSRHAGSPINLHIKRSLTAMARPRKQFRRSLSMYEHPEDVMKQEKEYVPSGLQSIVDVEEIPSLRLPHFVPDGDRPEHGSLPRISVDTMVDVLDGRHGHHYQRTVIIDCRFEYEYEGGHIQGAINYNDKEHLAQQLFAEPHPNTLVIFHCEYSNHRAPLMASYIRKHDRSVNAAFYPKLSYPEMYILDGGYSSFYQGHRARCFPQNYVLMDDAGHESACERGLGKIKQRAKFGRAQTFAFGQSCQMQDSPSRTALLDPGMGLSGTPVRMLRQTSY